MKRYLPPFLMPASVHPLLAGMRGILRKQPIVRALLLVSLLAGNALADCTVGNGGTVCRSNGASAASLVSGVKSVPGGALSLPVGISKFWFTRLSSPCGSDASGDTSHRIRLYPTGPQNGETVTNSLSCAGWHTFTEYPASSTRLGNILDGLTTGTYASPATEAGLTYFIFTGGTIASQFSRMQALYNARKDASGTWTVLVPVYDAADCSNPSSTMLVVGFATARIYNLNGTNHTIDANVDCRVIDVGSAPDPLSGESLNYGTQVASPGYCDIAEYCDGASTTCPADVVRSAGSGCSDDGNACTTDLCDASGACLHAAGNAGVQCRASIGICDVAESCSGSSTTCPADALATAGVVCRGSNGVCDLAESCTGNSADCPADSFSAPSVECRGSAGVCDTAEDCTGTSADCPSDTFLASTAVCRPAAGICDQAETCTGSTSACPVDSFAAATVECRASAGICDTAESCTGSTADCPIDLFVSSATVCRTSAGICDVAENCSGSAAACPTDSFAGPDTVCRSAAGVCDSTENCSGSAPACPADGFANAATVCRASAGICDLIENCSGSAASCPADGFASAETVCRSAADVCDTAENCSGSAASCPGDGFASAATVCRASAGVCDVVENCSGFAAACPANGFASPTTVCRSAAGVCDTSENCSGSAATCPADGYASAATVCRASAGVCDLPENCTGAAAACPANGFVGQATVCRASVGICDVAENCSGSAAGCPADSRLGSTTTCRNSAGECDIAESCDGLGASCPTDSFADTDTSCSSDDERCTDDFCDGAGACVHSPVPLAPACYWAVVGGSDTTTCAVRTRGESRIGGGVCTDSADIGESSSLNAAGSWALLEDSSTAARVRPQASILDGSVATGGGCIAGLKGSPIFGTVPETICCDDGDIPLPNGSLDNVINACGLHPLIDRCIQDKAQISADIALLDSLPATQTLGTIVIDIGTTQTLPLSDGLNVIDANKLNINDGGTLRIDAQGNPGAVLVLRLGRGMKTRIGARVELAGGAQPSNVLFYATRGSCLVGWQNQGAGTIFCPEGKVRMMVQSSWTGAIAGGSAIDIGWGVQLTHEPFLGLAR